MKYIMIDFFALMTKTERAMFDYIYNAIFRANRQTVFSYSSKLGYPGTSFSNGISNLSKVTANEWVGIMFVSAALCATVRGHLIFAKNMMTKWEKVVNEWKTRQQEANQSENQTSHTEPTHSSNSTAQETTSDEPPQDNEYDRDGNDDDSVDAEITAETVFEDDPVAYASVWDVGDREPYIDFLFLF